jgi:hypothetical protein
MNLRQQNRDEVWECKCECGNLCLVNAKALLGGKVTSCGQCGTPSIEPINRTLCPDCGEPFTLTHVH